jgi:hypothetical protein
MLCALARVPRALPREPCAAFPGGCGPSIAAAQEIVERDGASLVPVVTNLPTRVEPAVVVRELRARPSVDDGDGRLGAAHGPEAHVGQAGDHGAGMGSTAVRSGPARLRPDRHGYDQHGRGANRPRCGPIQGAVGPEGNGGCDQDQAAGHAWP